MWRSVLALILLPSLTAAQTAQTPGTTEPLAARASEGPRNAVEKYTFYDAIRRGTTEDVAVQLPAVFTTTLKAPAAGILPLKLELEPKEGFTISRLRYPKTQRHKVQFQAEPLQLAFAPGIRFKLRASDSASLGQTVLQGKLTFQPIHSDTTLGAVQQLDVAIPITVVDHDARVHKASWPFPNLPAWAVVTLIVLSPVLIPLALLYYSICAIEGPHNCPD